MPVGTGRIGVERNGLECRFGSLKPILASSPLIDVGRGRRAGREFGERQRTHCHLGWQLGRFEELEVDDH